MKNRISYNNGLEKFWSVEEACHIEPEWTVAPISDAVKGKKTLKPRDLLVFDSGMSAKWTGITCLVVREGEKSGEWVIKPIATVSCYQKMPKDQKKLISSPTKSLLFVVEENGRLTISNMEKTEGIECKGNVVWGVYSEKSNVEKEQIEFSSMDYRKKEKLISKAKVEMMALESADLAKKIRMLKQFSYLIDMAETSAGLAASYGRLYRDVLARKIGKSVGVKYQDLYLGEMVR